MIELASSVKTTYPQANFGVLTVGGLCATNERSVWDKILSEGVERIKSKHTGYDRKTALTTELLCHYAAYYRRYDKSYPVLGQLESLLLKGKGIPPVGLPIEAMFLAEVANLLLTAGHDLDAIEGILRVDVADKTTSYMGISGKERQLVKNDLYLSDERGVLSSVLNGPDHHTRITEGTRNALYFVYGVEGVSGAAIREHLETISSYLSRAVPGVEIRSIEII